MGASTEATIEYLTREEFFDGLRVDYEANILSLRQVAAKHSSDKFSISHVGLCKLAKRFEWRRDLSKAIHQRADAKLQIEVARAEVKAKQEANRAAGERDAAAAERAKVFKAHIQLTEQRVIEANATRIAQVRGEHRADIARARTLTLTLFEALEKQVADEMAKAEREKAANPDLTIKINVQLLASVNKQLIDALARAIYLEREAYGIDPMIPEQAPGGRDDRPVDRRDLARRVAFMLTREAIDDAKRSAAKKSEEPAP